MQSIATATMASGAPPAISWNWRRSLVNGDSLSLIASKAARQKKKITQTFLTMDAILLAVVRVWPESLIAPAASLLSKGSASFAS